MVHKKKPRGSTTQSTPLSQIVAKQQSFAAERPSLWTFTMMVLYKNLYILGIQILRYQRRLLRRVQQHFNRIKGGTYAAIDQISKFFVKVGKELSRRIQQPIQRISDARAEQTPFIAEAKANGKIPISSYLKIWEAIWRMTWSVLATLLNYLAPLAAVGLLLYTINLYVHQPLGLAVVYNNKTIGYVRNESEFEEAARILRDRFTMDNDAASVVDPPRFVLVSVEEEDFNPHPIQWLANKILKLEVVRDGYTKPSDLANAMVQASGDEIEWAYGLYVDNEFYGAVGEQETILDELEQIMEDNKIGARNERVEFIKKIGVKYGLYPVESIITPQDMYQLIHNYEDQEQVYTVAEGDTPTGIADKVGVEYYRIKEMNPDIEEALHIGDQVLVAVARPFLSVKNTFTSVYTEEYPFDVEEIETNTFDRNYREVTQEGENGIQEVTAEITTINGLEADRVVIGKPKIIKEAVNKKVIVGTNNPQRPSGGSSALDMTGSSSAPKSSGFIWPTAGGKATTYRNHSGNGVDIARPSGTPIYAAMSGTVVLVKSGYTGYGYHIKIDHDNGFSTLYAHCSSLNVVPGQKVSQGQVIGAIGRTGWATGNHLHFEIIYNGRYQYPVNYIGSYG